MGLKILLVEDERPFAIGLSRLMRDEGHLVTWVADGHAGLDEGLSGAFDVAILDVMLPGKDGWAVLEGWRRARLTTPVIMLTALDATEDKVRGLDAGADDYLPKPFEPAELLARVRALGRRDKVRKSERIVIADLEIDRAARTVTRAGQPIHLTRREFDLLEALALNERRVLSRETIQERVWGADDAYSNTVDVFIGTLRKKIDHPFDRKLIHTVVGFGYTLKAED